MFDAKAIEVLGCYVYGLFDSGSPDWPFYIGKGRGNRVFSHAKGDPVPWNDDEPLGPKLQLISEIKRSGRKVVHKIIRFGLTDEEAFKVEGSLIDLVNHIQPDRLKNRISGQGAAEGFCDAADLALSLSAPLFDSDLPTLVIKIERRWSELQGKYRGSSEIPLAEIYEATRGDWNLNIERARKAVCVVAVARGLVRAVFVPSGWIMSGIGARKQMTGQDDSSGFQHLMGTSVAHLFERGSQNPIRYLNCGP